jgi:hypothetical protein
MAEPIPGSTPAEYVVIYFTLPEDDDAEDDSGEQGHADFGQGGHAAGPARVRIVQIRCYPALGHDRTWELRRTVVRGIRGSSVTGLTRDTAADYVAQKISDAAFASTDTWWIVSDPRGFDWTAQKVGRAQLGLHRLLIGDRVEAVWGAFSGGPAPGAVADIASAIPLPVDEPLGFIKQLVDVAGMAVGVLAGFPVLTTACCKSFLHDQLTRGVAWGVRQVIQGPANPDREGRPGRPAPLQPATPGRPVPAGPVQHPAPVLALKSPRSSRRPAPPQPATPGGPVPAGPVQHPAPVQHAAPVPAPKSLFGNLRRLAVGWVSLVSDGGSW